MSTEESMLSFHRTEGAAYQEVFRITKDGDVVINPKFNVTDAARTFWEAVLRIKDDYDVLSATEITEETK